MSLQEKKAKSEKKIQQLSDNIVQRQAQVREYIEKTLMTVPHDWPYPSGWEHWLVIRLQGIEDAKKIAIREHHDLLKIEDDIVKEAEKAERDRIKAEKEADRISKEQQITERNRIFAEQEFIRQRALARLAAEEAERQAADEVARQAAIRAALIAELNDIINSNPEDISMRTKQLRIVSLRKLHKLGEISYTELLAKRDEILQRR